MDDKRIVEAQLVLGAAGFTAAEIVELIRTKKSYRQKYFSPEGLKVIETRGTEKQQRAAEMEELFRAGKCLEEIGEKYDLTRERVRQILYQRGVARTDGGAYLRGLENALVKQSRRTRWADEKYQAKYGCSFAECLKINNGVGVSRPGTIAKSFSYQKNSADMRGVPWKMTLAEYHQVWLDSGKMLERGRGKQKYCMARKGDEGAYEIGNVEIITNQQNGRDAQLNHRGTFIERQPVSRKVRDELGYSPGTRKARELILGGILSPKKLSEALGVQYGTAYLYLRRVQQLEPHLVPKPPSSPAAQP